MAQEAPKRSDSGSPLLEIGVAREAEITESDPVIQTKTLLGSHTDAPVRGKSFRLEVQEAGLYHIDLRSWFFDAYLVLRDADDNVLVEDDDGLLGTHLRIVHDLEAGNTYRVDACALRGSPGPFEIVLDEGRPVEPSPAQKARLAIEDAREGLRRIEALRGPDSADAANTLNGLANLLYRQGLLSEVRLLYERALALREKTVGPDHPDVAQSLNNLAVLLHRQWFLSEARPLYERALAINEKTLGPDHLEVANLLNNLAILLRDQGLFSEARFPSERAGSR